MTGSSIGLGRSVSSESTQGCESNGNKLKTGNNIGAAPSPMETVTAAALLWGRGPMTAAPLSTASSVSLSSDGSDDKTNSNSPASNAAAALLVGMSMRKGREANTLQATKTAKQPAHVPASAEARKPENNETFDVEARWREIRLEISQQSQLAAAPSSGELEPKESLELPKGVTRRPSGAWQAQIYFAGKTRYIGVWEKPQQAATAYNLAKEALIDLKAQQKSFRKRQRTYPGTVDTKVGSSTPGDRDSTLSTPHKGSGSQHLPSSITWPSSASSSSTTSSGDFRSPSYSRGPVKKRKGDDLSPESKASFGTSLLLSQQQQGSARSFGPIPPPSGHQYSAFSQHFHQQHMGGPGNNPLTHPALQLLSLRPPQSAPLQPPNSLWMQPQPPQYHPPQQYHQHFSALQQFPYSEATMVNSNSNGRNNPITAQESAKESAATKVGKKVSKQKRSKQASTKKTKSNKVAGSNSSEAKDKSEKDAQNQKWKTIRAEVVALFSEYKKLNGQKTQPTKTFDKDVLRGITVRPSGKFQAQLYFGGRSRYIGVFDSEYEAASAYEMIRSRLKNNAKNSVSLPQSASSSMPSLTSSSPLSSTGTIVQGCKEDEDGKPIPASTMRSITPSPTPRNNVQCKATNILTS